MEEKLLIINIITLLLLILSHCFVKIDPNDFEEILYLIAHGVIILTVLMNLYYLTNSINVKNNTNFVYKDKMVQIKDTLVVTNKRDTIKLKELKPVEIK